MTQHQQTIFMNHKKNIHSYTKIIEKWTQKKLQKIRGLNTNDEIFHAVQVHAKNTNYSRKKINA